jgi:hypothetical protein
MVRATGWQSPTFYPLLPCDVWLAKYHHCNARTVRFTLPTAQLGTWLCSFKFCHLGTAIFGGLMNEAEEPVGTPVIDVRLDPSSQDVAPRAFVGTLLPEFVSGSCARQVDREAMK